MNLSAASIHSHCFHFNGCQIEQPRQSDAWNKYPGWNHTLTLPSGQNGPEDQEAFGSTPSHSPSQSLARIPTPDSPETWYCLEIQVISTEDGGVTLPPPDMWQVPIIKDMVWDDTSGLTVAVVTSPGRVVLFYGQQLLGEGFSLGKAWGIVFMLSGVIGWVGKQAQLKGANNIIKNIIPQTPLKVGVLQSIRFSHTPDEARSVGLEKLVFLPKNYSAIEISFNIINQTEWETYIHSIPTQCQTSKPGWWLVVDHSSHHQRTHQTKRAWPPSFHSTCINTIQCS